MTRHRITLMLLCVRRSPVSLIAYIILSVLMTLQDNLSAFSVRIEVFKLNTLSGIFLDYKHLKIAKSDKIACKCGLLIPGPNQAHMDTSIYCYFDESCPIYGFVCLRLLRVNRGVHISVIKS